MNVLFVSIAFPPKQDPECLQVAKYFKYLSQHTAVTVVTSSLPTLNMPFDKGLEKYDRGYQQKIELKIPENRYLNFIIRKIAPALLSTPDSKFMFSRQSGKVLSRLTQTPDIIYSRSNPISSALLALQLKKKLNKPWVMHLSDPWADSPLKDLSPGIYKKNKALETTCFDNADAISFTTKKTLAFYSRLYPQHVNKFVVYPNVFDPEDLEAPVDREKNKKLCIVHTGGLTGKRSPSYIFDLLKYLEQTGFDTNAKIDIIFAGDADQYNRNIIKENPFPCFSYLGRLSYDESKALQKKADLLLCIEDPVAEEGASMFFPSKLLDYVVAQKSIVSITPNGSEVADISERYQWKHFEHADVEGLAGYVRAVSAEFDTAAPAFEKIQEPPAAFNAKENAERLVNLFKQLCSI